jgi:hypothetical protein
MKGQMRLRHASTRSVSRRTGKVTANDVLSPCGAGVPQRGRAATDDGL